MAGIPDYACPTNPKLLFQLAWECCQIRRPRCVRGTQVRKRTFCAQALAWIVFVRKGAGPSTYGKPTG